MGSSMPVERMVRSVLEDAYAVLVYKRGLSLMI
jgi:hypothetical protein